MLTLNKGEQNLPPTTKNNLGYLKINFTLGVNRFTFCLQQNHVLTVCNSYSAVTLTLNMLTIIVNFVSKRARLHTI